jgi:hypothetical protein
MTAQVKCSESPAPRKAFCLRLGSRKKVFALITASHVHPGSPPPPTPAYTTPLSTQGLRARQTTTPGAP